MTSQPWLPMVRLSTCGCRYSFYLECIVISVLLLRTCGMLLLRRRLNTGRTFEQVHTLRSATSNECPHRDTTPWLWPNCSSKPDSFTSKPFRDGGLQLQSNIISHQIVSSLLRLLLCISAQFRDLDKVKVRASKVYRNRGAYSVTAHRRQRLPNPSPSACTPFLL